MSTFVSYILSTIRLELTLLFESTYTVVALRLLNFTPKDDIPLPPGITFEIGGPIPTEIGLLSNLRMFAIVSS